MVHELDFEQPYALDRYSFELTEGLKNKNKTELHDILKCSRLNIPDARDIDICMATPLLHGTVLFLQDERLPKLITDDQTLINRETKGKKELQNTTKMHLTSIKGTSYMIRKILIILPLGWVAYEMKDGVMNMVKQQTNLLAAREVEKAFIHDGQNIDHRFWFGWYLFLVKKLRQIESF